MTKNLLLLAALLALTGIYTYYSDRSQGRQSQKPAPAAQNFQPAPDFSFQDIHGKIHNLSDFRGKVVVLNFWATWCAPCVIEMPQMISLSQAAKNEAAFVFLSIDQKEDDIKAFLKRHKIKASENVYFSLDTNAKIAHTLYQTYKIPETYIIDKNGEIADKIIGADVQWNSDGMIQKIKKY
jgi:cytochrome c biogenesis protein CcmG/thiol:disulfide interchange protein DsbE